MDIVKITIKPGEEWIGVHCRNSACGRTIPISRILPEMLDDQGIVTIRLASQPIQCPHCKTESVYQTNEAKRFRAEQFQ